MTEQTFAIDPSFESRLRRGTWMCLTMALLFAAGAVTLFARPDAHGRGGIASALLGVALFGGIAIWTTRTRRATGSFAVSVDDEGIWYTQRPRQDSLVRWAQVARSADQASMRRLVLLGDDGRVLIQLAYQLTNFSVLRELALRRLSAERAHSSGPVTFRASIAQPMAALFVAAFFAMLAWVPISHAAWAGPALAVVMEILLLREFLGTVYQLVVDERGLVIRYPMRRRALTWGELGAVRMQCGNSGRVNRWSVRLDVLDHARAIDLGEWVADPSEMYVAIARAQALVKPHPPARTVGTTASV